MPSRLKAAIPKLASLNIERSVAFFERLGFARRYFDKDYGIVERDGVQLHFWLCADPSIPKETACRIEVEGAQRGRSASHVRHVDCIRGNGYVRGQGSGARGGSS